MLARIETALAVACSVVICVISVLVIIDVMMRTLGFTPPGFTIAVVEYGLLYFTMLVAPYVLRRRGHVAVEAFVSIMPPLVRLVLAKFVYFACFITSLLVCYLSARLVLDALLTADVDVRGIDIPFWLLYLPMPIGFLFVALEFLRYLIGRASMYSYDLGESKDSV
jgi:TRAP-type C4-dicarboxylate transport system permease small subunit